MAINPTRQQTRLAKSQDAGKAVIQEINVTQIALKNLVGDLDQLQVRTTIEENAVTELNGQLMSVSAVEVKTDETVAEIVRLGNELKEHQEQYNLAIQEYATKRPERDALEAKLAALLNGPTMLRISSQEKALAKKEAAYQRLLKRHLFEVPEARMGRWTPGWRQEVSKTELYLDMDGVIVDFVSGALKALGITHMTDKDVVNPEMHTQLGMTLTEFWTAQDKDPDFWQNLKPYPGAVEFYTQLTQLADVYICSSPSRHRRCASDKINWLHNHLGVEASGKFYLCKEKSKLACLGRILIDDTEKHIDAWEKEAGWTFLFPRPWNAKRHHAKDIAESYELALSYVRTMTQ